MLVLGGCGLSTFLVIAAGGLEYYKLLLKLGCHIISYAVGGLSYYQLLL